MPEIFYTTVVDDTDECINTVRTDVMYVEGYCRGSSKTFQPRHAAIGIYLGKDDIRNKSIYIGYGDCTDQHAELKAVYEALKWIDQLWSMFPTVKHVIRTDSKYAYKCLTKWYQKWQRNKWRNSQGAQVANRQLIQDCLQIMNKINKKYVDVLFGSIEIELVEDSAYYKGVILARDMAKDIIDEFIDMDDEKDDSDLCFYDSDSTYN